MSRKRREQSKLAERARRNRRICRFIILSVLVLATVAVFQLPHQRQPEKVAALAPREQPVRTYLALKELPQDDESVRKLIRAEYFTFDGFTVFERESDIPIASLLVPDRTFSKQELEIVVTCINTIGFVSGKKDPAFVALKEWAERKPGRIIEELLPLDRKFAVRGKGYQFAFDAFWSPEMKSIYMGRHQMPYFMLFVSTLYQEAFHAVQLQGRKITLEANAAIEHEAHKAQLEFNRKLREFVPSMPDDARRFRLELDVIDENLHASLKAYEEGLIERTGLKVPKSPAPSN